MIWDLKRYTLGGSTLRTALALETKNGHAIAATEGILQKCGCGGHGSDISMRKVECSRTPSPRTDLYVFICTSITSTILS